MSFTKEEYTRWLSQLAQAWGPMLRQQKMLLAEVPPALGDAWKQELLTKVQELEDLLNALGTLASLEGGKPVLNLARGNLSSWITHYLKPFEHLAALRGISMQVNVPTAEVCTDQRLVEHLLSTLVGNAIRFCKTEGGTVRIVVAAELDHWKLQVIDNGIGIAKEKLAHVFNPLYAENIHLQLYQPAHLQLFLAQKRVEALGGTLQVESEKGNYTRFTATFPNWQHPPKSTLYLWQQTAWREREGATHGLPQLQDKPQPAQVVAWVSEASPQAAWTNRVHWYSTSKLALLEMPVTRPLAIVVGSTPPADLSPHAFLQAVAEDPILRSLPVVLLSNTPHPLADATLAPTTPADEWLERAEQLSRRYQSLAQTTSQIAQAPESFALKARRIMDRELGNTHFGVQELADALFLSRSQLHRKIKGLLGSTPQQFLLNHRLDHAQSLLESGRYSVAQVADRCGFSSPSYFTRAYKVRFGQNPKNHLRHR